MIYHNSSHKLKKQNIPEGIIDLVINHCKDNGYHDVISSAKLIVVTESTFSKKWWFWSRKEESVSYTFFSENCFLNFVISHKGDQLIISTLLKNIQTVTEFVPVQIGNKKVENEGFTLNANFKGLGFTDARSAVASYFLAIEKGPLYSEVKMILMDSRIKKTA